MNPKQFGKTIFLCAALSFLIAIPTHAVDRFWTNSASGNFTDPLNWDTTAPVPGDNGFINNGGTGIIDATQNPFILTLVLGSTNTAAGNIIMSGGTLTTTSDIRIGGNNVTVTGGTSGGTGTFTQSAGDVAITFGGNLNVGFGDPAIGTYNISGGNVLLNSTAAIMAIGNRGKGFVNQSGGNVYARATNGANLSLLNLGRNSAFNAANNPGLASGQYTLSGGNLTVALLRFGNNAAGAVGSSNIFNLQGGALVVSNIAIVNPNAVNRLNFTSGSLTAASVGMSLTNNGGTLRAATVFFGNTTTLASSTAAGVITSEIGTLTFGAGLSYDQGASGTLAVDISSTANDLYSLTGPASLLGNIAVNLLGGYDPILGSTFNILTATTVANGTTVIGTTPSGYGFSASIISGATNQTLQLTVVPEPATFALLGIPGLMFFLHRKFKK